MIPLDCQTWKPFAPKIARILRVELSQILLTEDGISIIDTYKIAHILEERGQWSMSENGRLKDALKKHYAGVNELLQRYWAYDLKHQRAIWLEQQKNHHNWRCGD